MATRQNAAAAAMAAGNCPQMILKHCRGLVRPKGAKEWFAITPKAVEDAKSARAVAPDAEGKVVQLPRAAAA